MFVSFWIQLLRCSGFLLSIPSFITPVTAGDRYEGEATVYAMIGDSVTMFITLPDVIDSEIYIRSYVYKQRGKRLTINAKGKNMAVVSQNARSVEVRGPFSDNERITGDIETPGKLRITFNDVIQDDYKTWGCFWLIEDDNKLIPGCGEELKPCNNSEPTIEITYQDERNIIYDGPTEYKCGACIGNDGSLTCVFVYGSDSITLKEGDNKMPNVTEKTEKREGQCNVHKQFTLKFYPRNEDFGKKSVKMFAYSFANTKNEINKREFQSVEHEIEAGPSVPQLDVQFHEAPDVVRLKEDLLATCTGCVGSRLEKLHFYISSLGGQKIEGRTSLEPETSEDVGGPCGKKITQKVTIDVSEDDLDKATLTCATDDSMDTKRSVKTVSPKFSLAPERN